MTITTSKLSTLDYQTPINRVKHSKRLVVVHATLHQRWLLEKIITAYQLTFGAVV